MFRFSKKKGLTLIEVLISFAILIIIVPAILSMVLTSVKTNKQAEDKQKAIYIAQKCVESIKSEKNVDINSLSKEFTDGDFKIKQTVTAEPEYYFPDKKSKEEKNNRDSEEETKEENFKTIKYNGKIIINLDMTENGIHVYDSSIEKNAYKIASSNRIEIVNGKDKNGVINDSKITVIVNGKSLDVDKVNEVESNKKCNFIIEFNLIDMEKQNDNIPKVEIHTSNFCNKDIGDFSLYLVNYKGVTSNYTFSNDIGKIKLYSNIFKYKAADQLPQNISRLYKVNVKTWRKEQNINTDKPIEEINSYKSVLE